MLCCVKSTLCTSDLTFCNVSTKLQFLGTGILLIIIVNRIQAEAERSNSWGFPALLFSPTLTALLLSEPSSSVCRPVELGGLPREFWRSRVGGVPKPKCSQSLQGEWEESGGCDFPQHQNTTLYNMINTTKIRSILKIIWAGCFQCALSDPTSLCQCFLCHFFVLSLSPSAGRGCPHWFWCCDLLYFACQTSLISLHINRSSRKKHQCVPICKYQILPGWANYGFHFLN